MSGSQLLVDGVYLASALLFVAGLRGLGKVRSAGRARSLLALAMLLAVVGTFVDVGAGDYGLVLGGVAVGSVLGAVLGFTAKTNGLSVVSLASCSGGAAAVLFSLSVAWVRGIEAGKLENLASLLGGGSADGYVAAPALVVALLVGAAALGAGLVAFAKREGAAGALQLPARGALWTLLLLAALALTAATAFFAETPETLRILLFASAGLGLLAGVLLAAPASSREVPAAVALLNGFSGLAAASLGFVLHNNALLITGGIVFAASVTLARILSEGMGRSLASLFVGGGTQTPVDSAGAQYSNVHSCGIQEAAMVLEDAQSVVIVPGFGYAVAQAQHVTRELAHLLDKRGAKVRYAIHPMAGRMPGHMNALLSEADVPYSQLYELDQINDDFKATDVVIVLGGNDIINPDAETARESAVYGMPILRVSQARTVFVVKRSLRPGYTGARNPLFEGENTMMLFGDAKKVLQSVATELKGSSGLGHAA
jgi:NAD(P) transhydrogenase subunit beta